MTNSVVRRTLQVLAAAALMLLIAQPSAWATNVDVMFNETTNNSMYGVHSAWDDPPLNKSIDCPSINFNYDWIDFLVQARNGSDFIELGVRYEKYGVGGGCNSKSLYYYQYNTGSGTTEVDGVPSVSSGNHDYAINQLSGDWLGRVDGGSTWDISGLVSSSQIGSVPKVRVGGECHQDSNANNDCTSTAEVSPQNGLTEKPTASYSGTWPDWSGQDSQCADYNHGARGKWNTDTGVHDGFNVTISGTITGPSC